jgi:8-oxo-dGTP pyrophosphatase MutT (NUDIX family)
MKQKLAPWKVIKSRISYEDRWLRVRTDTCETQEGHIIDPWHVIEGGTWVNVLALTANGQVVLVREYRHGVGEVLLGLPGGDMEARDESPLAAIQRELLEETGYGGGQFYEIGQSYANPSNQNNVVWSFLALNVQKVRDEQDLDEAENIEIVLQDFTTFARQAWSGEIPMQALYLATLGFASHFLAQNNLHKPE